MQSVQEVQLDEVQSPVPETRLVAAISSRFVGDRSAKFQSDWRCDRLKDKPQPVVADEIVDSTRTRIDLTDLMRRQYEDYQVRGTVILDGLTEQRYEARARRFFWLDDPREYFAVEIKIFHNGTPMTERFLSDYRAGSVTVTTITPQRFASLMGIPAH